MLNEAGTIADDGVAARLGDERFFLTATTGIDRQLSGAGGNTQRPDRVFPNPLCDNPNPSCWFNPAAFA